MPSVPEIEVKLKRRETCPFCGAKMVATRVECSTLLEGVAEYFDWLSNAEIFADECANNQARDAYARASSELGLILIRKGIYQPEKPSNAKLCGGGGQP